MKIMTRIKMKTSRYTNSEILIATHFLGCRALRT